MFQAGAALAIVVTLAGCDSDAAPSTIPSASVVAVGAANAGIADVPSFKGGNTRTSVMPGPGPANRPEVVVDLPIPQVSDSQPLVADGVVILPTTGGRLIELDLTTGVFSDRELPAGVESMAGRARWHAVRRHR